MEKSKKATQKVSQQPSQAQSKSAVKKPPQRTNSVAPSQQTKSFGKDGPLRTMSEITQQYMALESPSKNIASSNGIKTKSAIVEVIANAQGNSNKKSNKTATKGDSKNNNEGNIKAALQAIVPNNNNNSNNKKKKKTALKDLKPVNLEKEREVFFNSNCTYNPNFLYQLSDIQRNYATPHVKYFDLALKILKEVISLFGSEHEFNEAEGGPIIDQTATSIAFSGYIKQLDCSELVTFDFEYGTISPTCCQHNKDGTSRVVIGMPILYRELRIQGVLNHEIGTHFLRKHNDRMQIWHKQRKKYDLEPASKVEEGLALINQKFDTALNPKLKPFIFNAALHYYASVRSSQMSFAELYKDLEKFVNDPDKRWRECVRVKRGVTDTSQHQGMYKDQIYLIGIRRVLKYRNKCDLVRLHAGKITVKDCMKLTQLGLIQTDKMKLPYFLRDIELYKKALDRIAQVNFMADIQCA